ncbi:DUF4173 domain-containing protein [Streptomyces sp. NBC_00234]|uniref:DUF4153 domain-containing protein n=1 Tax=Streptomyces sp. NBC_00234 TaxID=2903638 RepID=UPI002E2E6F75|nr:DUF4153 domain-containing protein [Streptomyces sp. NBC_00234]
MSDQPSEASDVPEDRAAAEPHAPGPEKGAEPGAGPGESVAAAPGPAGAHPVTEKAAAAPVTASTKQPAAPEPPVPGQRQQQTNPWQQTARPPGALPRLRTTPPTSIPAATIWSVLATALLSAILLGDGLGPNLLIVAVPASLAAFFAARAAGRRPRPWTLTWAVGGVALLAVPALRDAGWPTFLAMVSALALGSLALHGSRRWLGIFLGSLGLLGSAAPGLRWGWQGMRSQAEASRARWGTVVRTTVVAVVLLLVFGTLFAGADAAFADLLGDLIPDVSIGEGPWRVFLFLLGLVGALAAAYAAAAPTRWDKVTIPPGPARGRVEWALPLIVLNLLFAAFIALQLAVLFGGYDKVLEETDLSYSEYARQGFWQLLWATLLTLLVIALALRWAPRGGARDRTLVRGVLGALCVLTLVVVASALRRMDLYVDAYGLTRLRISVAAMELWLGVVIVLIIAAGVFGARLLPRAVAVSAAVGVLAFGLVSPDGLIAEQNVQRYEDAKSTDHAKSIDIDYLRTLSADAVPALDRLPEPLRSCALGRIERNLDDADEPWYASSWGRARARDILEERSALPRANECDRSGRYGTGGERGEIEGEFYDPYDPY